MTVRDKYLVFGEDMAVTAVGATVIGDVLDLGIGRDSDDQDVEANPGGSGKLWLNVFVSTAFAASATASLTTALQTASSVTGTFTTALSSGAVDKGDLDQVGDAALRVPLPSGLARYVRLKATVAGTAFTAGALDGSIDWGVEQ